MSALALAILVATSATLPIGRAQESPDFLVSRGDISFDPDGPVEWVPFTISAAVHNVGNGSGLGDVRFYVGDVPSDGGLVGEVKVSIGPGQTAEASVSVALPAGVHPVMVHVINVTPSDGNDSNNLAFTTVEVWPAGAPRPDLVITGADIAFSRDDPREALPFTVYARIHNFGNASGTGTVSFLVDPGGPDERAVGQANVSVSPGNATVASVEATLNAGAHVLEVRVANVRPADRDLANNVAAVTIEVLPGRAEGNVSLVLRSEVDVVALRAGTDALLRVHVTAVNGRAIGVALVVFDASRGLLVRPRGSPLDLEDGQTGPLVLLVAFGSDSNNGSLWEGQFSVQAVAVNGWSAAVSVRVLVQGVLSGASPPNGIFLLAAGGVAVVASIGVGLGSTERGRYRVLGLILPLYTKLRRETLLNQYTRGKVHGYLLANPGTHFSAIGKALGTSMSNLAYHLRVLEREGIVVSRKDGGLRRFYPKGVALPLSGHEDLTWVQRAIYEVVREEPDVNQKGIAAVLHLHPSTVSGHLQGLVAKGLLLAQRRGMSVRYRTAKGDAGAASAAVRNLLATDGE